MTVRHRTFLSLPSPLRLLVALIVLTAGIASGSTIVGAETAVAANTVEITAAVEVDTDIGPGHVGSNPVSFDDWTSGCCVAPNTTPGQRQLFDADDFLAGGAKRADVHGGNWQTGNLGESVARHGGVNPQVSYSGQKTILTNSSSGMEIIVDNAGGYYRLRGADGAYRMLDGALVPANVPILRPGGGSVMSGVPKDVRQGLTHFWTGQS